MPEAHIEIEAEDGCIDAFVVCPDAGQPFAPLLLLSDSRGLRPAIEDIARRLAAEGFFVLAPDLFYRAGASPTDAEARHAAVKAVLDPDAQSEDFEAWLHGQRTVVFAQSLLSKVECVSYSHVFVKGLPRVSNVKATLNLVYQGIPTKRSDPPV